MACLRDIQRFSGKGRGEAMRKLWLALAIAGLMAVWSSSASAVTLYDNGGPDNISGFVSDPVNNNSEAYDYFTLSSPATITGINWWGFYTFVITAGPVPPGGDAFDFEIQSDNGVLLDPPQGALTPPQGGSLGNGNPVSTGIAVGDGATVYAYSATTSISLPAGTYYLGIWDTAPNLDPASGQSASFFWAINDTTEDGVWTYNTPGASWGGPEGYGLAFNLTGDVNTPPGPTGIPEPATMTLLGLGLAGLVAKVARRKNQ